MRSLLPLALTITFLGTAFAQNAPSPSSQWKNLEDALGRKGSEQPGGVYKFSLPRTDLHVRVDDVEIKPALALGGWLAFKGSQSNALVMGDLVLADDEVAAVTERLQQGGIQQTAIHNHLLHESPRVVYMHVMGQGDAAKLGAALKNALAATKLPAPTPPSQAALSGLDEQQIEKAIGLKGKVNGGVLQFSAPRKEAVTEHGQEIPPSMGTATAINFQPTGGGRAAITGDFVLTSDEVNKVIQALKANGIEVTALHSHMLNEQPRLFFMHFWANADAAKLAAGLKEALSKTSR